MLYSLLLLLILQKTLTEHIRTKRLVGGSPALVRCHPYMVSIQLYYGLTCGGTIVTSRWVLTAAHCTWDKEGDRVQPARRFLVMAGSTNWLPKNEIPTRQTSRVQSIHTHPLFMIKPPRNDISLLRLKTELVFSSNIKPVQLASKSWFRNNKIKIFEESCIALGWGRETLDGPLSNDLEEVLLQLVPSQLCQIMIYLEHRCFRITDHHLCTFVTGGRDFCKADSGGPLLCNDVQVGIVSLNFGCATKNTPSVWAKVDMFENWIRQTIDDDNLLKSIYLL